MSEQHGAGEACGLAERYLTGGLDDEETQRFEEHYLHCTRCLEQLELDEALGGALRAAAARDAWSVGRPPAVVAWLSRLGPVRQAALLVGALLVGLALPLVFAQRRLAGVVRERDAARAALAEARRAAELEGAGSAGLRAESERARREAQERRRLAVELERESRARGALERRLARALAPQANTPVLRLSPLRSLDGEPADRLRLGPDAGWVVLSLELASADDYPSYRVSLARAGAPPRSVWSHAGLVPDAEGSLVLSLHASMLAPGDYAATVEGLARGGSSAPVGRFVFRVIAAGGPTPAGGR